MASSPYGIFLSGSYGVGKSSTLDHLGDLFARDALPFSLLDVDWFHRSWPLAPRDPVKSRGEVRIIQTAWSTFMVSCMSCGIRV